MQTIKVVRIILLILFYGVPSGIMSLWVPTTITWESGARACIFDNHDNMDSNSLSPFSRLYTN